MHAGRAAEELLYPPDEMSTINQRRLVMARRIVQKLVVASAMTDNPDIGPRTISTPRRAGGKSLKQIVTDRVQPILSYDVYAPTSAHCPYLTVVLPVQNRSIAFFMAKLRLPTSWVKMAGYPVGLQQVCYTLKTVKICHVYADLP